MMAVLTVIAVAAVIRHAFCSGVSAGLLFSIPPSERARRLDEERNLWAATKCQALWRGYQQRQAAAGGGKKGKKGKGKKKK